MPKQEIDGSELFNLSLTILGLVLEEWDQSVKEMAERFSFSEKVIRKAVDAVSNSEDLSKCDTHFYLNYDAYEEEDIVSFSSGNTNLAGPPSLSKRQLSSIAIGLDYLASLPQFETSSDLAELRKHIRESAPTPVTSIKSPRGAEVSEKIQHAISTAVQISCEYRNQSGEQSTRLIDPLRMEFIGRRQYLRGYCHKNSDVRAFRLDRILSLELTANKISAEAAAAHIPDEVFGEGHGELEVTIAAQPEAEQIFWNFPTSGPQRGEDGRTVGKILVGNLRALPRHIVRYGGLVEVLAPKEAREEVRLFAQRVLEPAAVKGVD
jgi:predicted DNA-binding transcriptional regulator YafY